MQFNSSPFALLLSAACAGALLWSLPAHAEGAYTVHPWEFHPRRPADHRFLQVSDAEVYDFYYSSPQRSVTHGLHPINRRRYYNPRPYTYLSDHGFFGTYSDVELYEYDAAIGRWARGSPTSAQPPVGSGCLNYTFHKPNSKVPPFGYRCGS